MADLQSAFINLQTVQSMKSMLTTFEFGKCSFPNSQPQFSMPLQCCLPCSSSIYPCSTLCTYCTILYTECLVNYQMSTQTLWRGWGEVQHPTSANWCLLFSVWIAIEPSHPITIKLKCQDRTIEITPAW